MRQYLDVLRQVSEQGFYRDNPHNPDNTDEASLGLPGLRMAFPLQNHTLPLITCRSLAGASWKALVYELLWFLSGGTDIAYLQERNVHFWDAWASPETSGQYGYTGTEIGPVYGHQWRNFGATRKEDGSFNDDGFDQISRLVQDLRCTPNSKRLKVTSWNPAEADQVFIAPCHGDIKCFVANGELTLMMVQRSADVPIGVPFNIGSYALLAHMLAQVTGLRARELIIFLCDAHIYLNQMDYVPQILEREPKPLPKVQLNPEVTDLFEFDFKDIELTGYDPHPAIKGIPVAL
jgi:thymidylate synthase